MLECFGKFDSVFERRLHGRLADSERGAPGCFTGDIVERLLRFVDVSADRTAASISRVVKSILELHSDIINNKLIMQTYDGASVKSGHLNGVQALIRQEYPFAYFVHCAAHRLNLVLCQAVSSTCISAVKFFFTNVGAFSSFTSVSSKRKAYFT